MIYESRKDLTIKVEVVSTDVRCGTTMLRYLTGPKMGKTFSVSNSTLRRNWSKLGNAFIDNLDMKQIDKPYPKPKQQKYIPKPQSVIEYEERGAIVRGYNKDIPEYNELADEMVEAGIRLKGINKEYISLPDNTKFKRLSRSIGILASPEIGELIVNLGIKSRPCCEKGTPFRFDIKTKEELTNIIQTIAENQTENGGI